MKFLSIFIRKIGSAFHLLSLKLYKAPPEKLEIDIQAERVKLWFAANGDKTLRLDYSLDKNSVVIDLGGYEGQWSSDIFSKYCCEVHVFEPVQAYYTNIEKRFVHNDKIKVYQFGIGAENQKMELAIQSDGSSVHRLDTDVREEIEIKKASSILDSLEADHIDLMKINIEGAEYELLEHLIESRWMDKIKNLQIQFHDFVPDAESRMHNIQEELSKTHTITYQYEFVWENWKRKNN